MKKRIHLSIPAILVALALLVGIGLLIYGGVGLAEDRQLRNEYAQTEGYYTGYDLYSEGRYTGRRYHGPTYRLIYTYTVGGAEYTVATDYGTTIFPEYGDTRAVYYDPADPGRAVLGGETSSQGITFIGGMFTAVALVFILGWLYVTGRLPKMHIELMDVIIGAVTAAFGGGFLYFMQGAFPLLMAIPLMLVAAGVWLIIRGLFFSGKKNKRSEEPWEK